MTEERGSPAGRTAGPAPAPSLRSHTPPGRGGARRHAPRRNDKKHALLSICAAGGLGSVAVVSRATPP
eukprot:gene5278-2501_t